MKKVFLETSLFIRYLTHDDEEKYRECTLFLARIESGELTPYLSNIVILEIIFVLTRVYKFSKQRVFDAIGKILKIRNLTLIEKTDTRIAMRLFDDFNIKYTDCLIATQIPKGIVLVTYDADFRKIPSLSVKTAGEIV